MRFCVQLFSILLLTGISYLGNVASYNEPDCPNVDEMCTNLEDRLDWNDLLDPDSECPASNYVDIIDPMICEHMNDLFLPVPPNVTFVHGPQDKAVALEGSAEFKCVTDPEAYYIQWYFKGKRITDLDNPYSGVISFNGGKTNVRESEKNLIVHPVGEQLYGEYTCRVMTSIGVATASAWLSRLAPAQPCTIQFTHKPKNRLVKVNEYVKLRCRARSHNPATVKWYKTMADGVKTEITNSSDVEVTRSGLIIRKSEHSATYTCEVSSSSCKENFSAKVTVYEKLSEVCGTNPNNAPTLAEIFRPKEADLGKVDHGEDVKIGSIPWQVSMQSMESGHFCGAVVVDRYWVLTAAHCFILPLQYKNRADLIRRHQHNTLLRFGKQDLYKLEGNKKYYNLHTSEEQVRRIRRFVVHQRFRRSEYDYDFALVKLTKPLKFDDNVRPVCLPIRYDNLFVEKSKPGEAGIVSGWGNASKATLQGAKLTIQPETVCNLTDTNKSHLITRRMFCAGEGRIESSKACTGDSGGPFIVPLDDDLTKWYLAGIVSWGPPCLNVNPSLVYQQGFYANVSVIVSWILRTMEHHGVNWY